MLSLTSAKSGALIGVLISVTTIPAAATIGVAAAFANWADWRGAVASWPSTCMRDRARRGRDALVEKARPHNGRGGDITAAKIPRIGGL